MAGILLIGSTTLLAKSSILVYLTDLYNQVSIKPQERGSMIEIPAGTVTTDGRTNDDLKDRFNWREKSDQVSAAMDQPYSMLSLSLNTGQEMFETYCLLCHGNSTRTNKAGLADTQMNTMGMSAPALIRITPAYSDSYIQNKIKHGGTVMPSLGHATANSERRNIVHYIRQLEKGK